MSSQISRIEESLNELSVGFYETTLDGKFVEANLALATLLGYHSVSDLKQSNARFLYSDEADRDRWINEIKSAGTLTCTAYFQKKNGQIVRVQESAGAIREDSALIGFRGIVVEIRDYMPGRPVGNEQIRQASAYRRNLQTIDYVLDQLPICVVRKDRNRKFIWANQTFCRLEQVTLQELLENRNTDSSHYGDEFDDKYGRGDRQVFETGEFQTCREPHRWGDGSVRDVEVLKVPLFDDSGIKVTGVEVYFWDNVSLSAPLRDFIHETQIHNLFSSTETAIYEQDLEGNYQYISPSASELLGYPELDAGKLNMKDVVAPEYLEIAESQIKMKLTSINPTQVATTYEIELINARGRRVPVEVNSRLLMRDGKPNGIIGYIRDLTAERRRFSEVHHRVKNNLHTINALLHREQINTDLPELAKVLKDSRERILAIADLHEHLYKTNRSDQIAASEYLRSFIKQVIHSYMRPWQSIEIRENIDTNIYLSLDVMIPCTLILQELLSNSMKHAFPRRDQDRMTYGSVMVSLTRTVNTGEYLMQVTDTGVGLPANLELTQTKSLGMKLVKGLIFFQLKGELVERTSSKGTYFGVLFRDPSLRSNRSIQ
jgi:PAS domain S-box-containing protein